MPTKLELFGATDIGRKRSSNEDQFMVADLCRSIRVHHTSLPLDHRTQLFGATQGQLLLVADGMGGHEAGERASQLALDGVIDHFLNRIAFQMIDGNAGDAEFENQLKASLAHCQSLIQQDVSAVPQRRGMGSTLTMAYIVWPKLYLVHVGDSRCYLIRDEKIQQLTRDHTMASSLNPTAQERDESLPDEDGPLTNVLWNVLGGEGDLRPDALSIELRINDAIVLCTDGLTRYVSRKRLREVISGAEPLNDACSHLIAEANEAGGSDNITIVACRLREQEVDKTVAELSIDQSSPVTTSGPANDPRLADTEDLLTAETGN